MWVWEAEKAKAVFVIVHGANEYHVRYKWLIEMLNKSGFHVVMGDLPGQGENPVLKGHIDSFIEYIDVVEEWYKRAKQFDLPVFILGHSMGGLIVIQTMHKLQLDVRAIVLSSPCLGLVNPPSKLKHMGATVLNKITPKLRLATNLAQATRCEEMKKRDEEDPHLVHKVSVRWYQELVRAMENSHEDVQSFPNVPLLLLQGGDDLIVDKKAVFKWFNNVQITEKYYKEWPGLYHEVLNDPEKEKVFRVVRAFTELHIE